MAELPFGRPPLDAIAALKARGAQLTESWAWQDIWAEEHGKAFTVAKSAQFDVLKDIYDAVSRALAEGKTGRDFAKELKPILQAKGWWGRKIAVDPLTNEKSAVQLGSDRRLQLIYDVNMRVSYAGGAWTRFERARAERPWLRYVAILDMRTRPEHAAQHNVCLPIDHPHWETWAPPCGWNCRCTLQNLSDADVERLKSKLKFEPPENVMRDWTNRRTGEVLRLPVGIDPGWGHNPGKSGWIGAMGLGEKLIDAPPALAAAAAEDPSMVDALQSQWTHWFPAASGERQDAMSRLPSVAVVGAVPRKAQAALQAAGTPLSSGAIAVPQGRARHLLGAHKADAGAAAPRQAILDLPSLIARADAVLRRKDSGDLIFVKDLGPDGTGRTRRMVIVVRPAAINKVRPVIGQRRTIMFSEVVSVGIVDRSSLLSTTAFEVLMGSV